MPAEKTKTLKIVDRETRKEALVCVVALDAEVPSQGADITVTGTLTAAGELADCANSGVEMYESACCDPPSPSTPSRRPPTVACALPSPAAAAS